jgi:agmatinase
LLEDERIEQVLQLGIRSVCSEEVEFVRTHPDRARVWYAEQVHEGDWRSELIARIHGKRVFLTIDVDGLDPSIVPATGTPEPDGLTWRETLAILRTVTAHAEVVALDCVELAPTAGLHMADFAVAKLLYKTISYVMNARSQ